MRRAVNEAETPKKNAEGRRVNAEVAGLKQALS
jgi:hypothetical protein